jgi:hypothetical protein
MSDDKVNIEHEIEESRKRTKLLAQQFVQITFEKEAESQLMGLKESMQNDPSSSLPSSSSKEIDGVFVGGSAISAGTITKTEALSRRAKFNSLDSHGKAIVSLGLNSILDLSFPFPQAQSVLFERLQWKQLRARYAPKKYNVDEYRHILEPLSPIANVYNKKSSFDKNWVNLYKALKKLDNEYDSNIEPDHNDTSFCIQLLLYVLSTIKHQPHLFDDEIDSFEWDFVVKFWGLVTERLFYGTGLRLKWEGAHLTLHDTVSDLLSKADSRVLHDQVRQRHDVESDVGVFEAAEESQRDAMYIGNRCKVVIKSKTVIDKFVLDGCLIDSADSLQVCGLEVHFGNVTLAEPGLYVGTQLYTFNIEKSLSNMPRYFDLALHLLCFRDQCVSTANQYEDHLIHSRSKKISTKRTIHDLPKDAVIMKQNSVRGSWNPPRTAKTQPPPSPASLFGSAE